MRNKYLSEVTALVGGLTKMAEMRTYLELCDLKTDDTTRRAANP